MRPNSGNFNVVVIKIIFSFSFIVAFESPVSEGLNTEICYLPHPPDKDKPDKLKHQISAIFKFTNLIINKSKTHRFRTLETIQNARYARTFFVHYQHLFAMTSAIHRLRFLFFPHWFKGCKIIIGSNP
jgi:hypothetical protein